MSRRKPIRGAAPLSLDDATMSARGTVGKPCTITGSLRSTTADLRAVARGVTAPHPLNVKATDALAALARLVGDAADVGVVRRYILDKALSDAHHGHSKKITAMSYADAVRRAKSTQPAAIARKHKPTVSGEAIRKHQEKYGRQPR